MRPRVLDSLVQAYADGVREFTPRLADDFAAFLATLEAGALRAARPGDGGDWIVNPDVKRAILLGFRVGAIIDMTGNGPLPFADKNTYPVASLDLVARGVRVVPGGSSIRAGAYVGPRVTCMPPMYINVGAYVGEGTLVDSHALVGSCAQIGRDVHISAAAQIGGVLEPVGMRPVIIEDNVLVGGNCGVYEGTLVRARAVLASGVVLTASTPVYDIVNEIVLRATAETPLEIPAGAVVVPGSRPIRTPDAGRTFAADHGLHVACPIIVKYRDERTDARAALELDLR
ncbi:MAG: 2,3,4,5-tetrahydropyridine-2,6-dicarboxylate N-succinyltransferase [Myxococcales bacterium]|nr:2,3,4,5-tetrahydropyridine-2,6-dicarboxylate N-succinyltransferase [Myxococcales bacterium]MCB9533934.1 2,3,4,5-tetrahydropyridine-2,6-dicarboxylate N-succinyltransferase [Myxococcales bacterium]